MKKCSLSILTLLILCFSLFGCSDFRTPSLHQTLTSPWSTKPPLSIGMSKEKIKAEWGDPDIINALPADKWGTDKEEWIYWGRYPNVPIDYMYLSKTKHLIFEGSTLVDFFDAEEIRKKK